MNKLDELRDYWDDDSELLDAVIRQMSTDEANDAAEYIARMWDIDLEDL